MNTISQREGRRLRKRVEELECVLDEFHRPYATDYPGGVHISSETNATECARVAIATARRLGHVVLAIERSKEIAFYALPAPQSAQR